MQQEASIMIRFKDIEATKSVREVVHARCEQLSLDFPETMKIDVQLTGEGRGCSARAHAVGRGLDIAANHEWAEKAGPAAAEVLDKLEAQLRSHHDKKRMSGRRKAPKLRSEDSSG